jgi:hypothetical protein
VVASDILCSEAQEAGGCALVGRAQRIRQSSSPEIERAGAKLLHHGRARLNADALKGEFLLIKITLLFGNVERPLQRIAAAYRADDDLVLSRCRANSHD